VSEEALAGWVQVAKHLQGVRKAQRRWSYLAQLLKEYPASLRERLQLVYPSGKVEEQLEKRAARAARKKRQ
jgi:hypothetical protein